MLRGRTEKPQLSKVYLSLIMLTHLCFVFGKFGIKVLTQAINSSLSLPLQLPDLLQHPVRKFEMIINNRARVLQNQNPFQERAAGKWCEGRLPRKFLRSTRATSGGTRAIQQSR